MTERERQMCMNRLEADDRQPLGNFGMSLFKRILGRWHFWILVSICLTLAHLNNIEVNGSLTESCLDHLVFTHVLRLPSTDYLYNGSVAQGREDILCSSDKQLAHGLLGRLYRFHACLWHLQRLERDTS